jgi:hypothetical protein
MKPEKLIYRIEHGSRMYGTSTPSSDTDYKEVYVPSGRSILLQRIKEGRASGPKKEANEKNKPGDIDTQSFSVTKLFTMLTKGDIIGWELIFTPPANILYEHDWYWSDVRANYQLFLNRNVDGYVGYCRQQANKYGIRGSRIAAVRGMIEVLRDLGPADKLMEHWDIISNYAEGTPHCEVEMIENGSTKQLIPHLVCCGKKQPVHNLVKQARDCYQKVFDEYGHRALQAEKNEGIDWKAVSHACRVGEQAIELLETERITFPRPNADRLLSVKKGEVQYQEVSEYLDELLLRVEDASKESSLPEKPNFEAIDELIVDLHRRMI